MGGRAMDHTRPAGVARTVRSDREPATATTTTPAPRAVTPGQRAPVGPRYTSNPACRAAGLATQATGASVTASGATLAAAKASTCPKDQDLGTASHQKPLSPTAGRLLTRSRAGGCTRPAWFVSSFDRVSLRRSHLNLS